MWHCQESVSFVSTFQRAACLRLDDCESNCSLYIMCLDVEVNPGEKRAIMYSRQSLPQITRSKEHKNDQTTFKSGGELGFCGPYFMLHTRSSARSILRVLFRLSTLKRFREWLETIKILRSTIGHDAGWKVNESRSTASVSVPKPPGVGELFPTIAVGCSVNSWLLSKQEPGKHLASFGIQVLSCNIHHDKKELQRKGVAN